MRYRASFLAYAFWVHKNAMPKNWLMRVKGLKVYFFLELSQQMYRGGISYGPDYKQCLMPEQNISFVQAGVVHTA